MAYQTYTTEAIVCGSRANNTADKAFLLLTSEAGILWATARNVRSENSKQRFALQDFALIRVSLIKGKAGWRIGSVEGEKNYWREVAGSGAAEGRAAVVSLIRLLRQFLHGEVAHPGIFEDTKTILSEVALVTDQEARQTMVDIFSVRLLYNLGYIAETQVKDLLISQKWWEMPKPSKAVYKLIENAKTASHL